MSLVDHDLVPNALIYTAAVYGQWESVLYELREHPLNAMFVDIDSNTTALSIACHSQPFDLQLEVIKALIDAYPEALLRQCYSGSLPIHVACYGMLSHRIISALLVHYPYTAMCDLNYFGHTPLQIVANFPNTQITSQSRWEILRVLLQAAALVINDCFLPGDPNVHDEGLGYAERAFEDMTKRYGNDDHHKSFGRRYQFRATAPGENGTGLNHDWSKFQRPTSGFQHKLIVHAAVSLYPNMCPWKVVVQAMRHAAYQVFIPDRMGQLPLHIFLKKDQRSHSFDLGEIDESLYMYNFDTIYQDGNELIDEDQIEPVCLLLDSHLNIASVADPSYNNCLPLQLAIEFNHDWENAIEPIIRCFPQALCIRHAHLGIFTFQMIMDIPFRDFPFDYYRKMDIFNGLREYLFKLIRNYPERYKEELLEVIQSLQ